MSRHLHMVCPEVPWPANNSQAIDIVYQLKGFHESGVKVHLHYYCTDLNCHPTELNKYCETVHRYSHDNENLLQADKCSSNSKLVEQIGAHYFPIVFEGLYCTGILNKFAGDGRRILVRMYDDECLQCENDARSSGQILKKISLQRKQRTLKEYERALPTEPFYVFTIKENANSFRNRLGFENIHTIPLAYPFQDVIARTGAGNFCLYHGDLTQPCNVKAVRWLLTNVFNDINMPLVVAGRKPGKNIKNVAHLYTHSCLVEDPSDIEMEDLISKAHIHVLPSFSYKRPELKLLHALYNGRHCVVNENAVENTGLESLCYIGSNAEAFKSLILQLAHRPFEEHEIEMRKRVLHSQQTSRTIERLMGLLFD